MARQILPREILVKPQIAAGSSPLEFESSGFCQRHGIDRSDAIHPSALRTAQLFFQTYTTSFSSGIVLDIGAQDMNGCLREVAPRA